MTTIRILPEILSNQIAAGEVVERPVSVVKELVENSIDAGADSITVEVDRGGKSLIRVSDNGIGLSRDDALLSIERYATSKIFTKEDLFSISTMGFRGEALPSIASVSKFTMVTRSKNSHIGTKIEIAGGKIQNVTDAGAPVGTMVEVKNLFFNTPARKKFLKSHQTETSHIADAISGIALGNPDIRFRLFFDNRLVKNFPASDDLFQRSVTVLGKDVIKKLYPLDKKADLCSIQGYTAHPLATRSNSSRIFLFVNHRLIYDRGLVAAVFQGYKGRIMKGRFPLTVLFVTVPFDQVDVNVHPSKRQVKFYDQQQIFRTVTKAIEEALLAAQKKITDYSTPWSSPAAAPAEHLPRVETERIFDVQKVEQGTLVWGAPPKPVENDCGVPKPQQRIDETTGSNLKHAVDKQKALFFRLVGQVMNTYILAESDTGLLLIDQHAAHERIVYEHLKKRFNASGIASQNLVVPETLEFSFKEADALSGMLEELERLGIRMEPFGGATFIVKAVPSIIDEKQIKPLILDIVGQKVEDRSDGFMEKWLEDILILMACHNAVRANKSMKNPEMDKLIRDLLACENPMHCPHGRPVMITLGQGELEKLFKRVV